MKYKAISFLFCLVTTSSKLTSSEKPCSTSLKDYKEQIEKDTERLKSAYPYIIATCTCNACISLSLCPQSTPACVAICCAVTAVEVAALECAPSIINKQPQKTPIPSPSLQHLHN